MMRSVACAVVLVGAVAVLPPTAAAEQLHANVVSWAPADVKVGKPVSVVLELYVAGDSPYPGGGTPVAGVNDVEVVIRGEGQTRRFATADIQRGHYGAVLTFPRAGDWDLRVSYGRGSYGAGDEIFLGKGGIRIDAAPEGGPDRSRTRLPAAAAAVPILLAFGGAVLISGRARVASRSASRGSRRPPG